jgi:phage terminase Nu1 subunit (DNA packaging protein)
LRRKDKKEEKIIKFELRASDPFQKRNVLIKQNRQALSQAIYVFGLYKSWIILAAERSSDEKQQKIFMLALRA